MRSLRSSIATAISLFLAGLVIAATPGSAHAADVYRYWAYYTVTDGAFVTQETGPAGATPADGSVEGYRYAAPADFKKPNLPRADLATVNFDSVCGDKEAAAGEKRVAVLIDYGVEADANGAEVPQPEALCAVVPEKANGLQTLQAVAPDLRTKKSSFGPLLCGISGYPATGCADEKADAGTPADEGNVEFATASSDDKGASDSSKANDDKDDSNTGVLLGVGGLIVVLLAGGFYLSRRNRSAA
ncbi:MULTISPECIES: SCO2322 family protein [unclassified Nocardioides]|uniref:SCO2322 family protein n=1 Tax=unclassified Nocardioides TaxID=2615069 RepID=UPI0006F5BF4D|nr:MULTISPECIES: SCO2322 family protein [unclassified Nocardioides]KQY64573.1 hypothetical protein ASD30_06540 [Nocardioides sp. Root140]KQZ70496.1 hypothetical protein ASD66_12870 [Nocardioides sp. Root151]KRF20766.1 hypothetical protein ASH02_00125 [Nocardioides sp. Soil796]